VLIGLSECEKKVGHTTLVVLHGQFDTFLIEKYLRNHLNPKGNNARQISNTYLLVRVQVP
jgi:hypothetical protein